MSQRLLHVNPGNMFGGVESMLVTLARFGNSQPGLVQEFAVCFRGKLEERLRREGAAVHELGPVRLSRPWTAWRARRGLREFLERRSFDAVICHSAWTQAIFGPVVLASGVPLVFWLHDPPLGSRHLLKRLAAHVVPQLAICNSRFTLDRLPKIFPRVRGELVYCPVGAPPIERSPEARRATRERLGANDAAVVVLQVGRWEPHKGHLLHLEALAKLRGVPGWECWQVGQPQRRKEIRYMNEIREHAARLGIAHRVRFLGWQPELLPIFAAADIYCQPNTGPEPFGITYIEALYAGLPVVASAAGGPTEIIDESCGFLVKPGDCDGLAARLRMLIEDPQLRERFGNAGPARAALLCDPVQQIQTMMNCLRLNARPLAVNL